MNSVDTRYVNIKDQPNYYFYVHYNIETYLDYVKNNAQLYQFGSLEKQTREQYRTLAKQAEKTMYQLNQTLPEGVEAMEIVKQLDQYVKEGNSPILNYENNIKNLDNLSFNVSTIKKQLKNGKNAASKLNSYIDQVGQIMNEINKIDDNLKNYYEHSANVTQKKNLDSLFKKENLGIVNISKTSITAMKKIKAGFEALDNERKALEKNISQLFYDNKDDRDKEYKIPYSYEEDGKTIIKQKSVREIFNSIEGNLANLRGGIGEALISLFTIIKQDDLMDYFNKQMGTVEGLKIESTAEGEKTDEGVRSKADAIIHFSGNNASFSSNYSGDDILNFVSQMNISVKTIKKKKWRTSLQTPQFKALTTSFYNLFERLADSDQKYLYIMANYAALSGKNSDFKSISDKVRKYIAAKNMEWALEGVGQNKVQILAFMNQVITIDQYYNYVANYPYKFLPTVQVDSIASKNTPIPKDIVVSKTDDTPNTKNIAAIWRSQKIEEALNTVSARIMG